MANSPRIIIAALSLTAASLVGLWVQEGWTEGAVVPVKGDVPTVGPGLTRREDGSPVRMGDTIKPLEGAKRSLAHIEKDESKLKQCVTAPLHPAEYDQLVKHSYQYSAQATCNSEIVRKTNAGDYIGACRAHLQWHWINKGRPNEYDCATEIDGKPNKVCYGVWARSLERYQACMAAQ